MDASTTSPLKIHVDWSNTRPETAMPYTTCFQVGQWFKWEEPAGAAPPCESPEHPPMGGVLEAWIGLGPIAALRRCSFSSYQIREHTRCLLFLK